MYFVLHTLKLPLESSPPLKPPAEISLAGTDTSINIKVTHAFSWDSSRYFVHSKDIYTTK